MTIGIIIVDAHILKVWFDVRLEEAFDLRIIVSRVHKDRTNVGFDNIR